MIIYAVSFRKEASGVFLEGKQKNHTKDTAGNDLTNSYGNEGKP